MLLTAMLVATLQVDFAVAARADAVVSHFIAMILSGALALYTRLGAGAFFMWRGGRSCFSVAAGVRACGRDTCREPPRRLGVAGDDRDCACACSGDLDRRHSVLFGRARNDEGAATARRLIASKFSRNAMWAVASADGCRPL